MKLVIKYLAVFFISCYLAGCQSNLVTDPFWDIQFNTYTHKSDLLQTLQSRAQDRELENCVYSYRKETFIQEGDLDVKVIGNLEMPVFENQRLESLSYSLIVESKNDEPFSFNRQFFQYFKSNMEESYGKKFEEKPETEKVQLSLLTGEGSIIEVVVLKEINHYLVNISL